MVCNASKSFPTTERRARTTFSTVSACTPEKYPHHCVLWCAGQALYVTRSQDNYKVAMDTMGRPFLHTHACVCAAGHISFRKQLAGSERQKWDQFRWWVWTCARACVRVFVGVVAVALVSAFVVVQARLKAARSCGSTPCTTTAASTSSRRSTWDPTRSGVERSLDLAECARGGMPCMLALV